MTEPKIWTLGESIKGLLEELPSVYGGTEKMFDNVNHGFVPPDKSNAERFPMASIGVVEDGSFVSTKKGTSIDFITLVLPVFAYFYIENPVDANLKIMRFVQLFVHYHDNTPGLTLP